MEDQKVEFDAKKEMRQIRKNGEFSFQVTHEPVHGPAHDFETLNLSMDEGIVIWKKKKKAIL